MSAEDEVMSAESLSVIEWQITPEMRPHFDQCAKMYKWTEEAIPLLQAFVRVHNTIYRQETTWPDRLNDQFTTFPSWARDMSNDATGFKNPELGLSKIVSPLVEAKWWSVSIGGETRTLRKLFGMVTWVFV